MTKSKARMDIKKVDLVVIGAGECLVVSHIVTSVLMEIEAGPVLHQQERIKNFTRQRK